MSNWTVREYGRFKKQPNTAQVSLHTSCCIAFAGIICNTGTAQVEYYIIIYTLCVYTYLKRSNKIQYDVIHPHASLKGLRVYFGGKLLSSSKVKKYY